MVSIHENLVKYLIEGIATSGIILKPEKNLVENFLDHGLLCKGLGYLGFKII
jgi:hypothetical protein